MQHRPLPRRLRPSPAPRARWIGILLLAGCASAPPPETVELAAEVPETWTAPAGESPRAATAATEPWWNRFGDERLGPLVDEALEANRDLGAAAARIEAAEAQARIAGAALYPRLGAGLDGSRSRRNFIGFPIPDGGRVLSTTTTTFGSTLSVSWEADLWGRIRAGQGAALAGVEAATADLEAARLSLAGQAVKAWFALREARLQAELAEATFENRRLNRERIRRRYQLGTRPPLDLRLATTAEAAAEAEVAVRQRALDAARRRLELLLFRYPGGRLEGADETGPLPDPGPPVPAGLPSELIARRPDLLAAERRLAATGLGIRQARAALYPQLSLTGSAGRLSAEIEDLLESDFSVWSLAANLLQPLFQGGRLRAGVDLAEARYQELAEAYAQAVLRAFAEVELALAAEGYLARQGGSLARAVEQSAAAQRLAEDRYAAGLVDYLAVLEAQREANLSQTRWLAVRRQQLDARVDLHLALGGGFSSGTEHGAPQDRTSP